MAEITLPIVAELSRRLRGSVDLAQVVLGPRQVGKTTALHQVIAGWSGPSHYASADLVAPPDAEWLHAQWKIARDATSGRKKSLLVLDEVQKIPRWGEVVKALLDEDRRHGRRVRAVLLGSASLHVERGARESLAGRYELHYVPHWSFAACREAFGFDLDTWLYYGGYPGAAALVREPARWTRYVADSLIEAVLGRDVLQLAPISKPALLRQLFVLATRLPAQILSFNKMLGQLHDAGNTVTLAGYLDLMASAFLVSGLDQFRAGAIRQRASSPKLVVWSNALVSAMSGVPFAEARRRHETWGRLVENAVGAHLLNHLPTDTRLFYWREGDQEVDYVLERGSDVVAIEVKSGVGGSTSGLAAFRRKYPRAEVLVVGTGGVPLEKFFAALPDRWIASR